MYFVSLTFICFFCIFAICFFSFPPVIDECIIGEDSDIANFIKSIEETGIDVISSPQDYFFSSDLLFDGFCHCNSVGEIIRTEKLINDLERNGIISK